MLNVKILPPAAKFIKKIKDNKLKKMYQDAIDTICSDPYAGTANFYNELKRYWNS